MDRIKVGVIGIGFIGAAHVEALKRVPGVDVVAIVDGVGAEEKAKTLDVPHAFDNYQEMIEVCKPDSIHICTPNSTHKEIALYACARGIHVVCEKPMARNAQEAQEMLDAARASGIIHAVNFHNRYYPIPHQLRNMIQDGELGKIYSVHGGYLQDCFSKETDFNWRMLAKNSGTTRVVADIGSHWIDLAEYVTGQRVVEVFGEFQTAIPTRKRKVDNGYEDIAVDTEDSACILLRFSGGAIGSAVVTQTMAGKKNQTILEVSGSELSASWDNEKLSDLAIGYRDEANRVLTKDPALMHPNTAPIVSYPGGHMEGFPDAFKQNFIAIYGAIRGNKPVNPYATFEDGLHQMKICDALFESATAGKWVKVD